MDDLTPYARRLLTTHYSPAMATTRSRTRTRRALAQGDRWITLPDDVFAACLHWLDMPMIFAARAVSARWSTLCREVCASPDWMAAHVPLMTLLDLGAPTSGVIARARACPTELVEPGSDDFGRLPLMRFSQEGRLGYVNALLAARASPDATTESALVTEHNRSTSQATALLLSTRNNHPQVVCALLRAGALPDKPSPGPHIGTALHAACSRNFVECARLLISFGACRDAICRGDYCIDGDTAVMSSATLRAHHPSATAHHPQTSLSHPHLHPLQPQQPHSNPLSPPQPSVPNPPSPPPAPDPLS